MHFAYINAKKKKATISFPNIQITFLRPLKVR